MSIYVCNTIVHMTLFICACCRCITVFLGHLTLLPMVGVRVTWSWYQTKWGQTEVSVAGPVTFSGTGNLIVWLSFYLSVCLLHHWRSANKKLLSWKPAMPFLLFPHHPLSTLKLVDRRALTYTQTQSFLKSIPETVNRYGQLRVATLTATVRM